MIRVVAFDIGKVLLDFDYGIFVKTMAADCDRSEPELDTFLNQSPLLAEYESGQLTSKEFFAIVQKETGYRKTEAEFAAIFENIFTPIPEMIELHRELVERGMRTFTLSNTNEMAVRHIAATYDFWPRFEGHVLSHEVKSLKPAPEIYAALEQITDCTAAEIAYLDDRPENITAATNRDWKAIQHESSAKTRTDLLGIIGSF